MMFLLEISVCHSENNESTTKFLKVTSRVFTLGNVNLSRFTLTRFNKHSTFTCITVLFLVIVATCTLAILTIEYSASVYKYYICVLKYKDVYSVYLRRIQVPQKDACV